MTQPAWHRGERLLARPPRRVRRAADAAALVASDAQRLPRAVVAARARRRIAARLPAVLVVGRRGADPAGWMRAAPAVARDPAREVTRRAAIRRVAGGARAGLGSRFE